MTRSEKIVATLLGLMLVGSAAVSVAALTHDESEDAIRPRANVPRCVEDELIRGVGDFENGRWTRYECVHPDNL